MVDGVFNDDILDVSLFLSFSIELFAGLLILSCIGRCPRMI